MESNKSKKAKRQKYKLGSIVDVPLNEGKFAFARAYRDLNFSIYDLVSDHVVEISEIK